MYCSQCGKATSDSAKFCGGCGATLNSGDAVSSTSYGSTPQSIVVTPTKSVGVAVLLAALFGPLGMLYSTIPGAIIMGIFGGFFLLIIAVGTLGLGLLIAWPMVAIICMIWAAIATQNYNQKLLEGRRLY